MDWNRQKFCKKPQLMPDIFKTGCVDLVDGIDMDISLFDEMYRKTMDRVEAADRWYYNAVLGNLKCTGMSLIVNLLLPV